MTRARRPDSSRVRSRVGDHRHGHDAISKLDLSEAERTALNNNIPVAFAVTYLVGVIGAAWILSQLAPKLLRINLAEECRKLEEQMQGGVTTQVSARREHELRAYAWIPDHASSAAPSGSRSVREWRTGVRRAGAQPRPDRRAPGREGPQGG